MTTPMNAELRAAYEAYVALFWSYHHLPLDNPQRAVLARAVAKADARWRALADLPTYLVGARADDLPSVSPDAAAV
ncbi:MAG: hypothetical protein U0232_11555 [Thermomicrobiales bacterium]